MALIIYPDGRKENIEPVDGEDFKIFELKKLLDCEDFDIKPLFKMSKKEDRDVMIIHCENKRGYKNFEASKYVNDDIPLLEVYGPALIADTGEVK